jgi:GAF domain-containing protein/nitrogen-specific signal transduction histidine kinase
MVGLDSSVFGISLLILGLAFFGLAVILLRLVPRIRPNSNPGGSSLESVDVPAHQDILLVIQSGGRISYVNQTARNEFEIYQQEPNLERLARRARPNQAFWELCTSEGKARISMDGRPYDATSYSVTNGNGRSILLTMRPAQSVQLSTEGNGALNRTIEILTQLNVTMATDLKIESTLHAILQSVEQLIPSDLTEITIWNGRDQRLIPYRYSGIQGMDRQLVKASDRYRIGEGYSGHIAQTLQPLLVNEIETYRDLGPMKDHWKYPYRSFLGVPLTMGSDLIGTLELTSRETNAYSQNDITTLTMVSGQVAIAIHNALMYRDERRRTEELSSLANLAKAVSSVRDYKELFGHLIQGITPLLEIEIAGFLIYDENLRILEAKNPFIGVPPQFVELYKVPIPTDSPAESVWMSGETIQTQSPSEDSQIVNLGLDHSARAAGMRETALIPLSSGGRSIGYLQVANKRDGTHFSSDDLRLLEIVALQAAPIIENANLINQSVGRALRSEALRRIASLSGSKATLDEIFKYSLLELARLIQADLAGIFLLDENLGELRVHPSSLYGTLSNQLPHILRLPVGDANFRQTVTASKTPFLTGDASIDERVLPVFAGLVEPFEVRSVIDIPLIIRDRGFGEILLCSKKTDYFSAGDVQLAVTVAGQLANALERSHLASQTDEDLRQQVEQLTSITRISRELNTSNQLRQLLQLVYEEVLRTTGADAGSILLFELSETRPKYPKVWLQLGVEHPDELTPMERVLLGRNEAFIINDFEDPDEASDAAKIGIDSETWLPPQIDVRSAMVVPIAYQENVVGLIYLHDDSPEKFTQATLEITQALAVQAAIAIGNTRRYQDQIQRNEHLIRQVGVLSDIVNITQEFNPNQPLTHSISSIVTAINTNTPFSKVVISTLDQEDQTLHPIALAETSTLEEGGFIDRSISWNDFTELMQPQYRSGRVYLVPQDPGLEKSRVYQYLLDQMNPEDSEVNQKSDQDHDTLIFVPITKPTGEPLGLVNLKRPEKISHLDTATIEIIEIISNQISRIILSQQEFETLRSRVSNLTERLEHSSKTQTRLPKLIQENLDSGARIQSLTESTQRINAGLRTIDVLFKQGDRENVLTTLSKEIISQMGFDTVLVAEMTPSGAQLVHMEGAIPDDANPEALFGQRNPLRQCLSYGQNILVSDIQEDQTWMNSPLLQALGTESLICLPITVGMGIEAAVLGISQTVLPQFTENDIRLFELLSRQTSIAINNLNTLTETAHHLQEVNLLLDFTRQLGTLEPDLILRTLLDSAMQVAETAQAGFVALYDQYQADLIPKTATGYANISAMLAIVFSEDSLLGNVYTHGKATLIEDLDFAHHYPLSQDDLLKYREATGGILPVSCLAVPIHTVERSLGVLILDNFQESGAFSRDDQALVASLAQQTALTLENARLYQAAENRANQMQALSNVASTITTSLEPEDLIDSLLGKLADIVPYETGTLWLREDKVLKIHAARGFDSDQDLIGISTSTEDSQLFSQMMESFKPISVHDVRSDSRFPGLETERHSWLGVPLLAKGEMVGVIALEKKEAGFYTLDHIQAATTFASQAAIALENANLYQDSLLRALEMDQRSTRLAMLNQFSNQISSLLDPKGILEITTLELMNSLTTTMVSGVTFETGQAVLQTERYEFGIEPPEKVEMPLTLDDAPLFERLKESLGVFHTQDVSVETELIPLAGFFDERSTVALLVLPLVTGDELHGIFLIHYDQPYRYSADDIELARIITNQAAVAFQNGVSFREITQLSEELELRVAERTAELEQEYEREQSLLRIMRELSASLDLDQVLNQTLVILNETIGAEQSTILLAHHGEGVFYYRASVGYDHAIPPGGQLSSLKIDEGLAGWVVKNRTSTLVGDVRADERWVPTGVFSKGYNSIVVVPLMVGEEVLGVVTLGHNQYDAFTREDQDLAQAAAMQMAVAINNAELFNLIRDQAEGLGTMLRSQQIEASRSMAILEAVADGVLVTDDISVITLFNQSAQKILNLERSAVIGKSLDEFTGLFGPAAKTWTETIQNWSKDPTSYEIGDTFAERINLDNKRVVSIHLAPVVMGNEFLGTVSIFRDITHQVEVDRLKSEFVATVSHELRTPMTSIKGYVDILLMGAAGQLTEQQHGFLDIVQANTERLNILVNDLLDVSRIEAGKVELSIQPLNMRMLIEDVVRDQIRRSKDEDKPMEIHIELQPGLPRVPGDDERIRQILDNLLSNAYLYTPANGRIDIRVKQQDGEIQIDIQDNGIGIRPEDHERIFERFYRGEHPLVLASSGNGLGLSIVRQLINMHHGRLWLISKGVPGDGSTFSFTLPLENRL